MIGQILIVIPVIRSSSKVITLFQMQAIRINQSLMKIWDIFNFHFRSNRLIPDIIIIDIMQFIVVFPVQILINYERSIIHFCQYITNITLIVASRFPKIE